MSLAEHHRPTATELAVHARHAAFHRKIAARATALLEPPAPPEPDPPKSVADSEWFKAAWSLIGAPLDYPSIQRIQRVACDHFGIPDIAMVTACKTREWERPRQIAMLLSRELTPKSLPTIGRYFGGRDHSTAFHACRKIKALCLSDPKIADHVAAIRAKIEALA